jgi:uncharacterized surface protein with fasciclin (FAS1) repeats
MRRLVRALAVGVAGFASISSAQECPLARAARQAGHQATTTVVVYRTVEAAPGTILRTAAGNPNFRTLTSLLVASGLDKAVDNEKGDGLTVFAPTDEAFAKLPKETLGELLKPENKDKLKQILLFHVVAGKVPASTAVKLDRAKTLQGTEFPIRKDRHGLKVGNATVIKTDIMASNGIIHVIDRVLLPNVDGIKADSADHSTPDRPTVLTTAGEAGQFKTLAKLVRLAGLEGALNGDGPFTVFAPTDDAFAKLPKETVAALVKPENRDQLKSILTYHVIAGKVTAKQAIAAGSAKTLSGAKVKADLVDGRLKINNAAVIKTDLDGGNGIIHVIDTVLIP